MFHWCAVSLLIAALTWYILRRVVRKLTTDDEYILYVDEFAGNIFSGVFIMELGIIAADKGFYSVEHFACGFVMLFIRNSYFTYESVCAFVDAYYNDGRKITMSVFHIAVNIICQISGMVIGQYMARFFWSFDAFDSVTHTDALGIACRTSIAVDYPVLFVAFAEFLGPFTMCLAASYVSPKFVAVTVTTVAFINAYFFAHVSGSFYNQSMSTAFTFHCEGHEGDLEFFFVYWVAPTLGQVAGWELLTRGSGLIMRDTKGKME